MELFFPVQQEPADLRAYRVLGDQLLATGDAWGELIGLQCGLDGLEDPKVFLERKTAAEDLRDRLLPRLLGEAYGWRERLQLEWKWGFVRSVRIDSLGGPVAQLLAAPGLQAVQWVTAWHLQAEGGGDFGAFIRDLAERAPPSLRGLSLGGSAGLSLLLARHPRLEYLHLQNGDVSGPREPMLEELRLTHCAGALAWLDAATWPRLRGLVVHGSGVEDHEYAQALSPARFPALRELNLSVGSIDAFMRAVDSGLFPPLTELVLSGEYSDAALEALIDVRTKLVKARRIAFVGRAHRSAKLSRIAKRQLPKLELLDEHLEVLDDD